MPIQFAVKPGTILLCDYSKGGFRPPEMVKRRPVIVVSPRRRGAYHLCTVVPLSTTTPNPVQDYNVRIEMERPLPRPYDAIVNWVQCDMIATVGFERLDLLRTGRDQAGKRKYIQPLVSEGDFVRVLQGIRIALGLDT